MNRFPLLKLILKYSFIPGLILVIAGLVASLFSKTWSPLYVGLLIGGGVLLLVWLIYIFISAQGFWQRRSTQAGTNAVISTLSLVAILGLINFLVVRYSTPIDLTENQLFTLSTQSQEIVEKLQQPVKVIIFDRQPNSTDKDLLNNYRRYSEKFEYEFIDPDLKPGIAKEFNVKSLGDVYLQSGTKKQLVQSLSSLDRREPLSEIKLTNAIEKIQRDRLQTIYFLQGHGEHPLDSAEKGMSEADSSLKEKGYRVEPLNLAQSSAIPEDADVIVVAGPKRQLFPQEVEALKTYSASGGNLLLLIDPETNSGLEPLLQDWGVKLDNRLIIDASGSGRLAGLGPTTPIIINYGDHPIVKDFANGVSLYPLARRVETVNTANIEAFPILITGEQMWAESDLNAAEIKFDKDQDIAGPFDLGVALTRKITEKNTSSNSQASPSPTPSVETSPSPQKTPEVSVSPSPSPSPSDSNSAKKQEAKTQSRLVVVGNSTFATNSWFGQQLNGDVFLNSVQWLASSDAEPLAIRPREAKNRRLNLNPLQAELLSWMSLVFVPLLGLGLAGITWWKRRM